MRAVIFLSLLLATSNFAFAENWTVERFLQNGPSASAVASAVAMFSPIDCKEPLEFFEAVNNETEDKEAIFLGVSCSEDSEGNTGAIIIRFSEANGILTPESFRSAP